MNSITRLYLILYFLLPGMHGAYGQVSLLQEIGRPVLLPGLVDTAYIKARVNRADSLFSTHPDSSILIYKQVLPLSQRAGFDKATAKILVNMSSYYHNRGELDKCIVACEKALAIDHRQIIKADLARAYSNLGKAYSKNGLYEKGIYHNQKAIEAIKKYEVKDYRLLAHAYTELGLQYGSLLRWEEASDHFANAEAIFKQQQDTLGLAAGYINKAIIYKAHEKNRQAIRYAGLALSLAKDLANLQIQYRSTYILSRAYTKIGALDKADSFFKETVKTLEQMPHAEKERFNQYLLLAQNYNDTKEYELAEKMYRIALDKASEHQVVNFLLPGAHLALADLYARRHAFKAAYEHSRTAHDLYRSFLSEKDARAAKDIEAKYQTLEKDKLLAEREVVILRQQKKLQQKNFWIGGISLGVLLLTSSVIAIYRSSRHKYKLQQASLQNLQQQQEITQLQARVEGEEQERRRIAHELHDGIVSQLLGLKLNIRALQGNKERTLHATELNDLALQLAEATQDLRQTAHNLMPDLLLQQGLALSVAALCEKVSRNSALEVDFQAYGVLPPIKQEVELTLYRMIQELVQNALKYAEASQILVQLSCRDGSLNITVEDDGKGFPVASLEQAGNHGTGLQSLRQRAEILHGHMDIKSAPGSGTTVYLEFDLKFLI